MNVVARRAGLAAKIAAILLIALYAVFLGELYRRIPPNEDQQLFDYMAYVTLEGGTLYRDSLDINWPGAPLLHVTARWLFGNHYWSYRGLDYLLLVGFTGYVTVRLSRYERWFGYVFAPFYLTIYTTLGIWLAGQRDLTAVHAGIFAGCLLLDDDATSPHAAWRTSAAGALLFAAMLLKPTFGLLLPLFAIFVFVKNVRSCPTRSYPTCSRYPTAILRSVPLLGGFALAAGLTALWGAWTGALGDWRMVNEFRGAIYSPSQRTTLELVERLVLYVASCWHWIALLAVLGIAWMVRSRSLELLTILGLTALTVVVSYLLQGKGFEYHFAGLAAVLSIPACFFAARLGRLAVVTSTLRVPAALVALLVVGGLALKARHSLLDVAAAEIGRTSQSAMLERFHFRDVLETAEFTRLTTPAGAEVWTYGRHVMINSLADRPLPTPYAYFYFWLHADTPSRLTADWRRDMAKHFQLRPPELLILESTHASPPENSASAGTPTNCAYLAGEMQRPSAAWLAAQLEQNYEHERNIGRFCLWRLRSDRYAAALPDSLVVDVPSRSAP